MQNILINDNLELSIGHKVFLSRIAGVAETIEMQDECAEELAQYENKLCKFSEKELDVFYERLFKWQMIVKYPRILVHKKPVYKYCSRRFLNWFNNLECLYYNRYLELNPDFDQDLN
jgi:hypothetical protein